MLEIDDSKIKICYSCFSVKVYIIFIAWKINHGTKPQAAKWQDKPFNKFCVCKFNESFIISLKSFAFFGKACGETQIIYGKSTSSENWEYDKHFPINLYFTT